MTDLNPMSDQSLVDRVIAGDRGSFAELVRRYEPVARAAAVGILRDRHLAQDVLQESFLAAYHNLGRLTDRSRLGSWLLTIVRRQALRALRRRPAAEVVLVPDDLPAPAERSYSLDDESQSLAEAVGRLPDHEQVAVVLHYFAGHKIEAIAQMTGRTTSTVTKQLSRARRHLALWLTRNED